MVPPCRSAKGPRPGVAGAWQGLGPPGGRSPGGQGVWHDEMCPLARLVSVSFLSSIFIPFPSLSLSRLSTRKNQKKNGAHVRQAWSSSQFGDLAIPSFFRQVALCRQSCPTAFTGLWPWGRRCDGPIVSSAEFLRSFNAGSARGCRARKRANSGWVSASLAFSF